MQSGRICGNFSWYYSMNDTSTERSISPRHAVCGVCGCAQLLELFWSDDKNQRTTDERFLIARCSSCNVVQTVPQPPEETISQYYPSIYYPNPMFAKRYYERVAGKFQRERLLRLSRYEGSGKLLDIGCGIGYFVKAATDHGFEAEGLELDERMAAAAWELWNLPVQCGTLSSNTYPPSNFRVITLWQSLEHMHHPMEALETVWRLLVPGGIVAIGVPNFSSVQSRVFRSKWYHLDVPRHLFHYTPQSLTVVAERVGFTTIGVQFFSSEHNWAGILGSMIRLSPPGESLAHKAFRKLVGAPIARAVASIESGLGWGGTFELFARK